jgi:hypothetical protein
MKGILFLFLAALFFLPSVSAYEYCANSTARAWNDTFTFDSVYHMINGSESCPYGCSGGQCMPARSADTLSLAVIFLAIIFGFLYLGVNVPQESAYLSWLFIPLGIVFMAVGLFYVAAQSIFEENINASLAGIFYAIIMVLVLIISYFLITLVFNFLRKAGPYGKGKYG